MVKPQRLPAESSIELSPQPSRGDNSMQQTKREKKTNDKCTKLDHDDCMITQLRKTKPLFHQHKHHMSNTHLSLDNGFTLGSQVALKLHSKPMQIAL